MKPIYIFGAGKIAEIALSVFSSNPQLKVAGFIVDDIFLEKTTFHDYPILSYSNFITTNSPNDYYVFVALGYQELNTVRMTKTNSLIQLGFTTVNCIDPRISIPKSCSIGTNCMILQGANLQPFVSIADNCFIWSGATIGHHSEIAEGAWITSGVTIGGNSIIGKRCFLGLNSTIANDVILGDDCFVGAATLITKSKESNSVIIEAESEVIRLNSQQFLSLTKMK